MVDNNNKVHPVIAPDKAFFVQEQSTDIFLFHHENICCGYSLEVPHQGASNEYPQHTFSGKNE